VRVAGGPATRELFAWRDGRARWRAALSDRLTARLALAPVDEAEVEAEKAA
jgi:pilus assembly protein CpaF